MAARERYGSTLEALGCICTALLARNLESCCTTARQPSSRRSMATSAPTALEIQPVVQTALGGLGTNAKLMGEAACQNKPKKCCGSDGNCCERDSCSSLPEESELRCSQGKDNRPKPDCCSTSPERSGCSGNDCLPKRVDPCSKLSETAAVSESGLRDIEKGMASTEHVVLSVEGLTCVGCENKLFRSLDSIPSVSNLQTSLVLSQAEFDLDLSTTSVSEIICSIERATGFGCERIISKGQHLDVIVTGHPGDFVNQGNPTGVKDMTVLDKQTVRITFDAKVISARDLLESFFDAPIRLAPPRPHPALAAGNMHVRKTAFMTLLSVALTIPVLVLAWAPLPQHKILYGLVSLVLATIVQLVVAGPFYPSALKSLIFTRVIEMDLLIVLSTTTAYTFSVVSFAYQVRGHPLPTGEFFETSTLLVTLIMLGRLVSAMARQKAIESISIRSLQTPTALLVNPDGAGERDIDARLLQYDDIFKVVPDSRVPTDGTVVFGTSEVDESMVTGEVKPVEKKPGSLVIAGSVNGSGILLVRLTRLPSENTISQIANMVDEAKYSKPRVQELADRVAGYFVPVAVTLTVITFITWVVVGKVVRHESASSAAVQALTYSISVLIISCPCAIGLAVPMVVVIAGGVAAKRGVVVKSAKTIEMARKVDHVIFDKTGTLTEGQFSISAEEYLSESQALTMSITLGLTSNIKHPVSSAVAKHLRRHSVEPAPLRDVASITGKGIEGVWNGATVRAGNSQWLGVEELPLVSSLLERGLTVFCVSSGDQLLAVFGLEDSIRPDAGTVVSELVKRGITVSIVSGDDHGTVKLIAAKLGISAPHIKSKCTPRDKQQYIKEIISSGEKTVLFCGDGTNDAVALAQAAIGVHMDGGTDVAQSAADVVLVRPSLSGVLVLIDLSRASFHRIVFNFAWAFTYNLFAILLAAGAFVNARIPPKYAGLGELVSVLPVILVALQLKWARGL